MRPYMHKVQLHETTMTGMADSSDYIHWSTEACIDLMEQLGCPFSALQQKGILCPATSLSAQFAAPCSLGDEIRIETRAVSFNGVTLTLHYTMTNLTTDKVCCEIRSEHVFMDTEGHFVRLRQDEPRLYEAVQHLMA